MYRPMVVIFFILLTLAALIEIGFILRVILKQEALTGTLISLQFS